MLFTTLLIVWSEKGYCSNLIKKQFNKELAMTEKDAEDFESST